MTVLPDSVTTAVNMSAMEPGSLKTRLKTWWFRDSKKILCEFVCTMFLMYFGCMCCIPEPENLRPGGLYSSIGFGLVVMVNIIAFGHISGAHMNPIVTLASVIYGDTSVLLGVLYLIMQCLGSTAGSALLEATTARESFLNGSCIFCVTKPVKELSAVNAVCIEACLSAVLIFICCSVWDPLNKDKNETVSLKFGLAIVGMSLAAGPFTGASMNPARSLGPAILANSWSNHWVYWVGPCLGCLIAVFFYKSVWLVSKDETVSNK